MTKFDRSRRLLLQRAAAAAGTATVLAASARGAAAQYRSSPQAAGYQDSPNGNERCSNCLQFQPPAGCKVVTGRVSPQGWCRIYAAR